MLAAAKELAHRQGLSAGAVVSRLLRAALSGTATSQTTSPASPSMAGFRPFPAQNAPLVTNERIDQLRDEAGL